MTIKTTVPTLEALERAPFPVEPLPPAEPELTTSTRSALRLLARIHPTPACVAGATQAGELGRPTTINRRAADKLLELGFAEKLRQAEGWIQITPTGKREMVRQLEPGDVLHILRAWLAFALEADGRWELAPLEETCEVLGVTSEQWLDAVETGVLPL